MDVRPRTLRTSQSASSAPTRQPAHSGTGIQTTPQAFRGGGRRLRGGRSPVRQRPRPVQQKDLDGARPCAARRRAMICWSRCGSGLTQSDRRGPVAVGVRRQRLCERRCLRAVVACPPLDRAVDHSLRRCAWAGPPPDCSKASARPAGWTTRLSHKCLP
jgi:hypothetical protein